MKTINNNTKQAQSFINAYNYSRFSDIYEAYNKPSTAKTRADYFCKAQMQREGGQGYKIISRNSFQFSVAWTLGNSLRIETPGYSYVIPQAL